MNAPQATELIKELQQLSANCTNPPIDENRAPFSNQNRARVREIGQSLHELGGYQLMEAACKSMPKHDQLELTWAWDGIGIWEV